MDRSYDWTFPLPRTHTGILQGNGVLGLMIWGGGETLCITAGRADFWDHRGGLPWREGMSYTAIRDCLERGDEAGLRALFEQPGAEPGQPRRPSLLPIGRFELVFPGGELTGGTLALRDGTATIRLRQGGREHAMRIVLDMEHPAAAIRLSEGLELGAVKRVTSWDYVGDHLQSISFAPPAEFEEGGLCGWLQTRPVDPPLCAVCERRGQELALAVDIAADEDAARQSATARLGRVHASGFAGVQRAAGEWWTRYWQDVPTVDVPNPTLRFLYDYGMYKFAGLTNPDGVAAGLQGPWIEEYQMPPWSGDYHFNINVQMCYWPAYRGNRLTHLRPLFDLIHSWLPALRYNAKVFLGIDDGVMLPHAVDDRCVCMGGFWTGSIDHGCTAWVAEMMMRYVRYSGDADFLRAQAWPFMVGAMRVYEEMLERDGDGFVLPVSVSPEYRGASMHAWGRNASFQLACVHRLCEDLLDAAEQLGETPKPIWMEIRQKLPQACLVESGSGMRIGLWEGTDLEESHRHHSHLAALVPFDIIDADDPAWRPTVLASIANWIYQGPGLWSGWCMPWASMLQTRLGNADCAELLLEIWERVFTNVGRGTLHDADFAGFSLMGIGPVSGSARRMRSMLPEEAAQAMKLSAETKGEIMQMDAGMAAVAAILEMLLHARRGVHYVFGGAPVRWKDAGFAEVRTEGGFLVSAERRNGRAVFVEILAELGGEFRLHWDGAATLKVDDSEALRVDGPVLNLSLSSGQTARIEPA